MKNVQNQIISANTHNIKKKKNNIEGYTINFRLKKPRNSCKVINENPHTVFNQIPSFAGTMQVILFA